MKWQISKSQKKLLDSLFEEIPAKFKNVLDVGSGRTSVFYLTEKYKNTLVQCVVYPGDKRKIEPIKQCVKNNNYKLIEADFKNFNPNQNFDVILAHLFLGEAEKFGKNKFEKIIKKLFSIKTKYLILINLFRDNINYNLLLKTISQTGKIVKLNYVVSESGEDCLGMTIKFNSF